MKIRGNRRGIALITILIVSMALLAILSVGLKLGSSGVLYVSQTHQRNVALSAAEAGVYEAMLALENDKNFSGTATGTLSGSHATYTYKVENDLIGGSYAKVISTGQFGSVKRTLSVELEPDSAGFEAMSLGGRIYVFDRAYVNAIASPDNAIVRPGSSHTEYNGSDTSFVGRDLNADGDLPTLMATGDLTTPGSFDGALKRISRSEDDNLSLPQYRLDPTEMESGSFSNVGTLAGGTLGGNTRVTSGVEIYNEVIVPKGVTLVIDGDAKFFGGLRGEGQVVVHGDALIRTNSNFDPSIQEGIKLHADQSVFLTHPSTELDAGTVTTHEFNEVGDYFASMPMNASSELCVDIPTAAPKGGDFFTWFDDNVDGTDPDFSLWYNGDGTNIHPGLSEDTKAWLQKSRPLHSQIAQWADAH